MNREQIMNAFRTLAKSQGFYGRLIEQIESVDEEARDAFLSDLESRHFNDVVELVMWIEG